MAKELVFFECSVIPGARKESHLACNHEARVSPKMGRGFSLVSPEPSFHAPAALCGREA